MDRNKILELFCFVMENKNKQMNVIDEYLRQQIQQIEVPSSTNDIYDYGTETGADANFNGDMTQNEAMAIEHEEIPMVPVVNQLANSRKTERMQLALTPDQRTQIELIRGPLTSDQAMDILTIINPYFESRRMQIVPYNKPSIELNSYVCMHFFPEDIRRFHLFCPNKNFQINELNESMGQQMERLVPGEIFNVAQGSCFESTQRNDDFIIAVAFALCRAMHQPVSMFQLGCGNDGDLQHIRNVITDLILKDVLPLDDENGDVWRNV